MKTVKARRNAVSDDYLELVKRFPLRRLRSDEEQEAAAKILTVLWGRVGPALHAGEREYADALSHFMREYDERVYPMPRRKSTPLALIKSLMEDHGMGVTDLGRIMGSTPAASLFLDGSRQLSKNHIRRLSAHFKIHADALL